MVQLENKMSDSEDILGDDFVDPGFADDTYNLGNEEEDILLADDTFEINHYEAPKQPIVQEKLPEPAQIITEEKIHTPHVAKEIKHEAIVEKNSVEKQIPPAKRDPVVEDRPTIRQKPVVEKVAVVQPEPASVRQTCDAAVDESTKTVKDEAAERKVEGGISENRDQKKQQEEPRHRAGRRERFPTERESDKPPRTVAASHIPDTLDSVVTADSASQNFHGSRGLQRFREDRRPAGRGRDRYFPDRSVESGPSFRSYQEFRHHPNASPLGGNFMRQSNGDFGPPSRSDSRNFGSDFSNPPLDFQRGPMQDISFAGRPEEMGAPGAFPLHQDNRGTGRPFANGPRFSSDVNRRPPVGLVPPLFETFHGPVFRHASPTPPSYRGPETQSAKKVLINPHFKGPLPPPPQRLVYPTSRPPIGVEMHQRPPPLGERSVHMSVPPPYIPAGLHHGDSFPPRNVQYVSDSRRGPGDMGFGGAPPFSVTNASGVGTSEAPVSDEALERLTEQFIDEQRRCLQKAKVARNDDFFEKTQRFIENTTKDVRSVEPMMAVDPDAAEKERLRRKQEEFIDANRHNLSLNLRRRRPSPPHRPLVSASSKAKPRKPFPPAVRKRSRSPQSRSGMSPSDPEEREYRARLREQAEMRERVLSAKERRRRRDANTSNVVASAQTDPAAPATSATHENTKRSDPTPKYPARTVPVKPSDNSSRRPEPKRETVPAIRVETVSSTSNQSEMTASAETPAANRADELMQDSDIEQFLDDLLEDDALHLSAADEDLLLSDEDSEKTSPRVVKQTKLNRANDVNNLKPADAKQSTVKRRGLVKTSAKLSSSAKPVVGSKRQAANEMSEKTDLRTKLARSNETALTREKERETSRRLQPRRQIVYSDTSTDAEPAKQLEQNNSKEKPLQTIQSSDKWRSTFTEEKAKRIAPIAVRAISAVIRTATSEANVRKVIPPARQSQQPKTAVREPTAEETNRGGGIFGGRRVVLGAAKGVESVGGGRVVLPRQKRPPLLVVEKEEETEEPEPYDQAEEEEVESGIRAAISGLPPGMTEARLVSLCGSQVEKVKMGIGSGAADVTFQSSAACRRFIARFNGRFVAASCLSVRLAR